MTAPNLPARVTEEYGTGLEDIEDEVGALPRIGINHPGGTFKDTLSGEEFPEIHGVALGLIKQRVMWAPVVEDGAKPLCKSQDATTGYPNAAGEKEGGFPWSEASGLDPNTSAKDEHGRIVINCEGCPFSEWIPDAKTGKRKPPPCKERHTYPIIFNRSGGNTYEPPYMESGIVSFQSSGIGPSKKYLSAFVRNKRPLYSAVVRITLDTNKRGMVTYSVPAFAKMAEVPEDEWELYAREYAPLRDYLRQPPRPGDDADPLKAPQQTAAQAAANAGVTQATVVSSTYSTDESPATAAVNPAAAAASVQEYVPPAPTAVPDDDELPF